jgi:hypothetical protein
MLCDRKVIQGVPSTYPEVGTWLLQRVGHDFPLFAKFRHPRTIRALATMLRDNLDLETCNVPASTKLLCGIVYATKAKNPVFGADLRRCALFFGSHLLPGTCDLVARFAEENIDFSKEIRLSDTLLREVGADLTLSDRRALLLAKAGSTTPSTLTPVVLGGLEELFSPPAMIEQIVWLGICQMFHRLYLFYLDPIIAPNAADVSEVAAAASKEEAEEEEEYGFYMQAGDDEGGSADEDLPRPEETKEEYKSSIARRGGRGGKLVLQGAEPVYGGEDLRTSAELHEESECVGSKIYGKEKSHESAGGKKDPIFKHRQYVQEDELTELVPVMSPMSDPGNDPAKKLFSK